MISGACHAPEMAAKKTTTQTTTPRVRGVNTRGWTTVAVSHADHVRLGELAYACGRNCGFRVTRGMLVAAALDFFEDLASDRQYDQLKLLHTSKDS